MREWHTDEGRRTLRIFDADAAETDADTAETDADTADTDADTGAQDEMAVGL